MWGIRLLCKKPAIPRFLFFARQKTTLYFRVAKINPSKIAINSLTPLSELITIAA